MMDYVLENGKTIRIPKATIANLMKNLDLDEEDAIQVYLEDEAAANCSNITAEILKNLA